MAINTVKAGKGLKGGGSASLVTLSVDDAAVPALVGNNEFKGGQKINGNVRVNGDLSVEQLWVDTVQQVPKLNATFVGGVPLSGLARLNATNAFKYGQDIHGPLDVISHSAPAGTFESAGNSMPGLIAIGGDNIDQARIPEAPPAIVGYGGMQRSRGLGVAGAGVYGEGGEQTGRGTGGTGVSGQGGFGGDGGFGGTGGGFQGGEARNGLGGTGIRAHGGTAWPRTRSPQPDDGLGAGEGIVAKGGVSYDPSAPAGGGATFFGGYGQFGHGADGIWGIPGFSGLGRDRDGRAGVFQGDVLVMGEVVAWSKSFRIDHPLDPSEKLLTHACVESSELLTVYTGNVVLDRRGRGVVVLPDWFEALNADFRYHLTPIGAYAPIFVSKEIASNRFEIAGGKAGLKVSWQVTAVRRDPQATLKPLAVESQKLEHERGYFIHPEAYGQPTEKSLEWARDPSRMKRITDVKACQQLGEQSTTSAPGGTAGTPTRDRERSSALRRYPRPQRD